MTGRQTAIRCAQVILSIGLLGYLVASIPMRDVWSALLGAKLAWLAGALAITAATTILASLQMRAILAIQGMRFSLRQIAGINLITAYYGLFLPGYLLGGLVRLHHFSAPEGKRAQALAAIIFSRGVELVTTIGFGIVFWNLAAANESNSQLIVLLLAALAAAVLLVLSLVSATVHAAFRTVLTRLVPGWQFRERIFKVSACLVDFGRCGRMQHVNFLLLCIARNAFGVVAFVCFARSLGIAASVVDLGWVRAALDLVLILPISFAGLGVREVSLVVMLGHLGIPSSAALAFSFLLLARTLLVALLGGILEGLRLSFGIAPGLHTAPRREDSADRQT